MKLLTFAWFIILGGWILIGLASLIAIFHNQYIMPLLYAAMPMFLFSAGVGVYRKRSKRWQ